MLLGRYLGKQETEIRVWSCRERKLSNLPKSPSLKVATLGCDFRSVLQGSVWLQELGAKGQVYGLVGIASLTFRIQEPPWGARRGKKLGLKDNSLVSGPHLAFFLALATRSLHPIQPQASFLRWSQKNADCSQLKWGQLGRGEGNRISHVGCLC